VVSYIAVRYPLCYNVEKVKNGNQMKPKYTYKTKGQMQPSDRANFIAVIGNKEFVTDDGVPLVHSKEVALEPIKRLDKRNADDGVYDRNANRLQQSSTRINKDTGKTLYRGIQLYRLWFRFLKLALELEKLEVSLVTKNEVLIRNVKELYRDEKGNEYNKYDIPDDIKRQSEKEFAERKKYLKSNQTSGGDKEGIYRCKLIEPIKVDRSKYKGWDLDSVLTDSFDKWWETHSHLFEGYYPKFLDSKEEWIDENNFLYLRIDINSQSRDVDKFIRDEVFKKLRSKESDLYKISGKQPRVNVFQNNYNALVLSLKGWSNKDICENEKIYLRRTDTFDNTETGVSKTRTSGYRLTVTTDKKGKKLYSSVVSKQRNMGIWHLKEVCDGRFGNPLPTKK